MERASLPEATSTFPESTYNKIAQLASQAQTQKAPQQKFAMYYTPFVIFTALAIAVFPQLLADLSWNEWIYRALVLLVIVMPHYGWLFLLIWGPVSWLSLMF